MTTGQYISVREAAQLLGISEKKIMDLIEVRKLLAYRIADKFLRLKRTEVMDLRNAGYVARDNPQIAYSTKEKIIDFFYFNDFYIICLIIIFSFLYIIFFT
jgi:excisionase family DNA binding protein